MSDVVGMLDGPVRPIKVAAAIAKLRRTRHDQPADRAGRGRDRRRPEFHKGEMIDTGLDVPEGACPLGVKTFWDRGRIRQGVTCACATPPSIRGA